MKNKILLCFLGIIFISGCKKKDIDVPNPDLKALFATWNLVEVSGGFSGGTQTPATMGYKSSIEFDKDGQVYQYKNGRFLSKDKFKFVYNKATHSVGNTHYTLQYDKNPTAQWVYIHKDTLHLDDAFCNDCYSYTYVRK